MLLLMLNCLPTCTSDHLADACSRSHCTRYFLILVWMLCAAGRSSLASCDWLVA